jgi:hypothetical protein
LNCSNGKSISISITMNPGWVSGDQYNIALFWTDGCMITYQCIAP